MTEGAARELARCRAILEAGELSARAGHAIARPFRVLETAPDMGRPA
ncbi:hypothetical protein [Alloalcanivorax profundimaris]|nr:hypothetical protein [Alloalcanivorax profundimaris]MBF1802688.1 hypothetical protein [Alloalcanivorax profundimaris]MCQ6262130.1 hypothetical protein [Alcanivorax sp. MM125-6]QJX01956.1 hypothetical protein HML84_06390 [Alcanivorax sp. IO_7]UWN48552.1 hypothetical protein ASALC70_00736 [Alcanivorax sp. ALC70]|tara:strand:- start:33448 stop:33588 length:141 start_codon:yes stop_codon:yes gene_type:complete